MNLLLKGGMVNAVGYTRKDQYMSGIEKQLKLQSGPVALGFFLRSVGFVPCKSHLFNIFCYSYCI